MKDFDPVAYQARLERRARIRAEDEADPARRKANFLRLAQMAADDAAVAWTTRANCMRMAREAGASWREIAEATGVAHMTVKRLVEGRSA